MMSRKQRPDAVRIGEARVGSSRRTGGVLGGDGKRASDVISAGVSAVEVHQGAKHELNALRELLPIPGLPKKAIVT